MSHEPLMITAELTIPDTEFTLTAVRAQGAGGQHINKTSSAIHLRFDIRASSLPEHYKTALLSMRHHQISADGIIIIKAQEYRSQDMNRVAALARLQALIKEAGIPPKTRHATRPSRSAKRKRTDEKVQRGQTKLLRRKVNLH